MFVAISLYGFSVSFSVSNCIWVAVGSSICNTKRNIGRAAYVPQCSRTGICYKRVEVSIYMLQLDLSRFYF